MNESDKGQENKGTIFKYTCNRVQAWINESFEKLHVFSIPMPGATSQGLFNRPQAHVTRHNYVTMYWRHTKHLAMRLIRAHGSELDVYIKIFGGQMF